MGFELTCGAHFLHIPKTGGEWVEAELIKRGFMKSRYGNRHDDFDRVVYREYLSNSGRRHIILGAKLLASNFTNLLFGIRLHSVLNSKPRTFCFVRHPLSWFESYWRYNCQLDWPTWGEGGGERDWHCLAPLNGLGASKFSEFMENVLITCPGFLSHLYSSYIEKGGDLVGRTEFLERDFRTILERLGHKIHENETTFGPPKNHTNKKLMVDWTDDLKLRVLQMELAAVQRFAYFDAEVESLLGIPQDSSMICPKLVNADF